MITWFLFVPLIVIAVSIPLILEKIPRNHFYGFRTPKTLSSDTVWYQANKIGGQYFVIAGVIQLVAIPVLNLIYPAQLIRVYGGLLITIPLLVAVVFWFVKCARL